MMFKKSKKRGFSLIEVLVYTAILAVIAVVVTYVLVSAFRSYALAVTNRNFNQSADAILSTFNSEIRSANNLDKEGSVFSDPNGLLVVGSENEAGDSVTVEFFLEDQQVKKSIDNSDPVKLSTDRVKVSELWFYQEQDSDRFVRIEVLFEDVSQTRDAEYRFYSSGFLRK